MVSGFEDWNIPVDINLQSLSEVINRPKYGSIQTLLFQDAIWGDAETSLGSVSGTGMIYGGFINVNANSLNNSIYIKTKIDDLVISGLSPYTLLAYGLILPDHSIPSLIYYDDINHVHTMGFSFGITFEESLEITFFRSPGVQSNVTMLLHYALI